MIEQLAGDGLGKFRHDMLVNCLTCLTLVLGELADSTHAEEAYDLLRPYAGRVVIVGARRRRAGGRWITISACSPCSAIAPTGRRPFRSAQVAGARLGTPGVARRDALEFGRCSSPAARKNTATGRWPGRTQRTADAPRLHRLTERLADLPEADTAAPEPPGGPTQEVIGTTAAARCAATASSGRSSPAAAPTCATPKGVRHLATLLAQPGRSIHVLDLVGGVAGQGLVGRADAGDLEPATSKDSVTPVRCSMTAKDAYRRRLTELELIAEAEQFNDIERVAARHRA